MNKIIRYLGGIILVGVGIVFLINAGVPDKAILIFSLLIIISTFVISKNKFLILFFTNFVLLGLWKYFEASYMEKCSFLNCDVDLSGILFLFGVPIISIILLLVQIAQFMIKRRKQKI